MTIGDAIHHLEEAGEWEYRPAIDELKLLAEVGLLKWAREYQPPTTDLDLTRYGMPPDLRDAIGRRAEVFGCTVSQVISQAVTEWISDRGNISYQEWRELMEQAGHQVPPTYRAWLEAHDQKGDTQASVADATPVLIEGDRIPAVRCP